MKAKKFLVLITLLTITMGLTSCVFPNVNNNGNKEQGEGGEGEKENVDNPINAYHYDGKYDDLEVNTELEPVYSTYNYKDYDRYEFYDSVDWALNYSPSVTSAKYLIVPIWFTDSDDFIDIDYRENVRQDIEKAYLGTEEETGWESVKTYYAKDSFGKLEIDGVVTDWYPCQYSYKDFCEENSGISMTRNLVLQVYTWYKKNNGNAPLLDFDRDTDGFIDSVILIYGALDQYGLYYSGVDTGKENNGNMWGYTYWAADGNKCNRYNPGPNAFFWASYDFMYSWGDYAKSRTGKSNYGTGDTKHTIIDSHTFVHETGHLFGLPDYYNYGGGTSASLQFSMQDHNIGAHDPYSRFALNWASAYVPTETVKLHLKPMEESGEFILLTPQYNNSAFDEYLAIELYTPTRLNEMDATYNYGGYHVGPQTFGVRLWHIDSRLYSIKTWSGYEPTSGVLTSNPKDGKITNATSNSDGDRSVSYAGSDKYRQLTVLRNGLNLVNEDGTSTSNTRVSYLIEKDLFKTGDYFTMEMYAKQFVETGLLNSKQELGWAIYFDEVTAEGMTVTCIKR